jgi:glucose-1-phosphate cytidylyltransferase
LMAFEHDGFYATMDTFKDKQLLDDLDARGEAPWEVWKAPSPQEQNAVRETEKGSADATTGHVKSRSYD